MEADLIFPESYKADGFTNNVTSSQAAEPDPVVRELLQNRLDAAIREAGRERAEVHFTIVRRPVAELPGLSAYRRAFEAAVAQRAAKKGSQTHDERAVIDRIRGVLQQREMSVLFCRDNGVGLDHTRMEALLTEGNSDKPMVGAGSYGLGHLTAFAASDLHCRQVEPSQTALLADIPATLNTGVCMCVCEYTYSNSSELCHLQCLFIMFSIKGD